MIDRFGGAPTFSPKDVKLRDHHPSTLYLSIKKVLRKKFCSFFLSFFAFYYVDSHSKNDYLFERKIATQLLPLMVYWETTKHGLVLVLGRPSCRLSQGSFLIYIKEWKEGFQKLDRIEVVWLTKLLRPPDSSTSARTVRIEFCIALTFTSYRRYPVQL